MILILLLTSFSVHALQEGSRDVTAYPTIVFLNPDGIEVGMAWEVDGTTYWTINGTSGAHCSCAGRDCVPSPTPTEDPTGTPTEPTPTDTPGPTPTPKPKCNRGIGNLSEDCDPGNSYGQGRGRGRPAGEDRVEGDGAPPSNK